MRVGEALRWGAICALSGSLSCGSTENSSGLFDSDRVPALPRVTSMLDRPLTSPSEIATVLAALQTLEEHAARIAERRTQDGEVLGFAQAALAETAVAKQALAQSCSTVHAESEPYERIRQIEQDFLGGLAATDGAGFDRTYLAALAGLHTSVSDLLERRIDASPDTPEASEVARLRTTLDVQSTRLSVLKSRLGGAR